MIRYIEGRLLWQKLVLEVLLIPIGIQSTCQMMIGVYNHLLSKVFRLHYHSQKVIGSLGNIHVQNRNDSCFGDLLLLGR